MMITRILLMASVCVSLVQTAESAPPVAPTPTTANSATPASSPTPAAPPSEASIKQLLEVAQSHKLVDSVMSQMDNLMEQTIAQATKGQQVSAKVQKDIDRRRAEVAGIMKELLDWKKLQPMYVRIYQKTFTQPEVDGMIAFYKSPAGQAVITKMPSALQTTMDEMQGTMGPVMQKMQQMQQDVVAEIKAENKNKGG
jgi:hypothetical protein